MIEPLVSVHMITYNHAPYIAQAIEGVIQQKVNFPIELVIGEDWSTDGTREIVLEYKRKYPDIIRVILSDENIGGMKNAYRTAKACRGKYIAFCEGDDYWHRLDKLQKQVDYLETHPECGMVSSDVDIYYDLTKEFKRDYNYSNGFVSDDNLTIEQVLWGGLSIWTCTVVIRRCLYRRIVENDPYLYENKNIVLGDLQVWAELTKMSRLFYIPETLAVYRVLHESASRSKDRKKELCFLKSISDIKLYLSEKYRLPNGFRKKEEETWVHRSLLLALYEKNPSLANEVKKKVDKFTIKNWARFLGAKYLVFNYSYRVATIILHQFKKKQKQWP